MIGYLQRQVRELAKKRAYCKNTVAGKQRGKKYQAAFRAEVVMAMLGSNSICAVAKKYGVPESTIRSWMSEEAGRSDAFAKARQEAAREIAIRASLGVRAQVTFLQGRAAESQRAAQITERLHRRLDEDTRARDFAVGTLLKDDPEELADATETGLVVYASPGSYDRQLDDTERRTGAVRGPGDERQERGRCGQGADGSGRKGCCHGPGGEHRQRERSADGGDRGSQ